MVHVEVDDRHLRRVPLLLERARGHGHVVEQAEAHGAAALGVVPGRTQGAERAPGLAAGDPQGRVHRAAGGAQGGVPARGGHVGVGIEVAGPRLAAGADAIEMALRVHGEELGLGGRGGFGHADEAGGIETLEHRLEGAQAIGTLGVALSRVVGEAAHIGMKQDGVVHEGYIEAGGAEKSIAASHGLELRMSPCARPDTGEKLRDCLCDAVVPQAGEQRQVPGPDLRFHGPLTPPATSC